MSESVRIARQSRFALPVPPTGLGFVSRLNQQVAIEFVKLLSQIPSKVVLPVPRQPLPPMRRSVFLTELAAENTLEAPGNDGPLDRIRSHGQLQPLDEKVRKKRHVVGDQILIAQNDVARLDPGALDLRCSSNGTTLHQSQKSSLHTELPKFCALRFDPSGGIRNVRLPNAEVSRNQRIPEIAEDKKAFRSFYRRNGERGIPMHEDTWEDATTRLGKIGNATNALFYPSSEQFAEDSIYPCGTRFRMREVDDCGKRVALEQSEHTTGTNRMFVAASASAEEDQLTAVFRMALLNAIDVEVDTI